MLKDAVPLEECGRALVVKLRHHGDVLLASPVLALLKARAPKLEVDALVYDDTLPMLEGHPALSQLYFVGRRWRGAGAMRRFSLEKHLFSTLRAQTLRPARPSLRAPARRLARAPARRALQRRAGDAASRRVLGEELHASLSDGRRRPAPPGRAQPRRARRIGVQPGPRRAQGAVRARRGGRAADRGAGGRRAFRPRASRVALALQVLAGGAQRRAHRPPRRRRPQRGAHLGARRDRLYSRNSREDKVKARVPGGTALHQGAGRAHRAREALRRRRLDADAPRRGDGHADGGAVRAERRERVGAVERRAARGDNHAHLPAVRLRRLRRRQALRVPRLPAGRPGPRRGARAARSESRRRESCYCAAAL